MSKFKDPNLQLTVLQALWNQKLLPSVRKKEFFKKVTGDDFDESADYNYEVDSRIRNALLAIKLPSELLQKLTSVVWDGGNPIHHLIWTFWSGESNDFDIHSLEGIEVCSSLKTLKFVAGVAFTDLSPVAKLSELEVLMVRGAPQPSITPLLSLSKLKEVDVSFTKTPENESAAAQLSARKVTISS